VRRGALLLAAALAACSRPAEPARPFPVGLEGPVSFRLAEQARSMGLDVGEPVPEGAAVVPAAVPGAKSGSWETADRSTLRFFAARAAASGAAGAYFRLPPTPEGRDLLDYPEEWQAVTRALRELAAMRPVLERGRPAALPFPLPPGVEGRAWDHAGRRYVLLVNGSDAEARLDADALEPWRALFEVRSDARRVLSRGYEHPALPPGQALWLEGRPL
jgi:hypothetical protein